MKIPEDFRNRIYKMLVGPVEKLPVGDNARVLIEELAARDLDGIEPIIEELLDAIRYKTD